MPFNGELRDELLERELFLSLEDARWVVDRWQLDDNHHRIHSALDYQPPRLVRGRLYSPGFGYASAYRTQPNLDSLTQAGTKSGGGTGRGASS